MRKPYVLTVPRGRHTDPDFVPSLRLLVNDEQYSLYDIALMFNVSRERVRQWCVRHGITSPEKTARGLRAVRVWDDTLNRFRPTGRGAFKAERQRAKVARNRAMRDARSAAFRAEVIAAAEQLRRDTGTVRWSPLLERLGIKDFTTLCHRWGGHSDPATVTAIKTALQITHMPRGRASWANAGPPPSTCPRHAIPWNHRPSGKKYCPQCEQEYNHQRRTRTHP